MKKTGFILAAALCAAIPVHQAAAAVTIPFTVNLSEATTVTGSPQIAVDVGGTTRYAVYSSGSGTTALTFTLSPQPGDVDLDGVTVTSPIQLNGGTLKDAAGNDATLTFTPPNTSGIKIDYPSLKLDFANNDYILSGTHYASLPAFLTAASGTFSRSSVATFYDNAGTLQTASTDTPRFDYDPVTHAAKGILIEETRTNLLVRSGEADNAAWARLNISVLPNTTTAPDGTVTADKLIESTANTSHYLYQSATTAIGTTYTFSAYLKQAERSWVIIDADNSGTPGYVYADLSNGVFGTQNGTLVSKTITSVGNGWYRVSITYIANATNEEPSIILASSSNTYSYAGDGSSGVYIWGAQFEPGPFPTSYIPTTTAALTRQADSLVLPIATPSSVGTIFSQGSLPFLGSPNVRPFASVDDNTSMNVFQLRVNDGTADIPGYGTVIAGVATGYDIGTTYGVGNTVKTAVTYQTNNLNGAVNGTLGSLISSTTIPTFSKIRIGKSLISLSQLGGWVNEIKHYPSRISDAQAQLLTQ